MLNDSLSLFEDEDFISDEWLNCHYVEELA